MRFTRHYIYGILRNMSKMLQYKDRRLDNIETPHFLIRTLWRKAAAALLVITFIMLLGAPVSSAAEHAPSARRVIGYLPTWSYQAYETLDFSALTHLNIAFCNPDASGNMSHGLPSDRIFRDIIEKAHQHGVHVLASLGGAGGSDHYADLITAKQRNVFNKKILDFVSKFDLDGLDIDIEGDAPAQYWDSFEGWALSLKKVCDDNDLILTTTVSTWYSGKISDSALAAFDFVNVMAYDGDHSDHSPYSLAETMMAHYEKERGLSKEKLVLGVPFFGFQGDRYIAYKTTLAQYAHAWSTDFVGGVAHNGIPTLLRKCELAKEYGGIMIWELSMDVAGDHSLLRAIKEAMQEPFAASAAPPPVAFDWSMALGTVRLSIASQ